jgi:hypothetical protein
MGYFIGIIFVIALFFGTVGYIKSLIQLIKINTLMAWLIILFRVAVLIGIIYLFTLTIIIGIPAYILFMLFFID